jgi:hypothetical protein
LVRKPARARWLKPRPVQVYAGKIEMTLSYPAAGVCVLVVLVSLLAAYQLGRWNRKWMLSAVQVNEPAHGFAGTAQASGSLETENEEDRIEATKTAAVSNPPVTPPRQRGNAIAILSCRDRTQLVPVQDYFDRNGIPAVIVRVKSGGFMLATVERFRDNPARPGSDGYVRLQQVIELGAAYRPPPGFLGFTRESFEGAHGVLFE